MIFTVKKSTTQAHFFDIELKFLAKNQIEELQLPAWRPGRYELQNFSKNVQYLKAYNEAGEPISTKKTTKDKWEIIANKQMVVVTYTYYANKKDAGSSYVDDDTIYLNFVNCFPYPVGQIESSLKVLLQIPEKWECASALNFKKKNNVIELIAKSFYEIYDCPLIAKSKIDKKDFTINKTKFQIAIAGNYEANWKKILPSFQAFSQYQINVMGSFPEPSYLFLIWILPTAYYHGVEHSTSTMIVLGPDSEGDSLLPDLLGVSSHELFHAWNICKIRPKELLPYNYAQENYFDTGFIVEGVTTYFGDLFLLHAGVISLEEYLKELTAICTRHFIKDGKALQSIVEASLDLWVDGYTEGIPHKKVSIYNKGALLALLLDLQIRKKFNHTKGLYDIMRKMWETFGAPNIGYTLADYKAIAENVFEGNLDEYFSNFIFRNKPLEQVLQTELEHIGLQLKWNTDFNVSVSVMKKATKNQKINLQKFLTNNKFATV